MDIAIVIPIADFIAMVGLFYLVCFASILILLSCDILHIGLGSLGCSRIIKNTVRKIPFV